MQKNPTWPAGLFLLGAVLAPRPLVAQEALPAPLSGMAEEGRFTIYVNEDPLITISSQWADSGAFQGSARLSMAGQVLNFDLDVAVGEDGLWTKISLQAPQGRVEVTREGSQAVVHDLAEDQTRRVDLKPGSLLWFDYQPAFLRQAVAAYDQQAGGEQTLPVFVIPATLLDLKIERLGTEERAAAGRDLELSHYQLGMLTVEMDLWVDSQGQVLLVEVPSQHAAYVREGYEGLRAAKEDPLLSKPAHGWKLVDEVMVPMRDGMELATDVYLPDAEGRFPVVLVRTPYKKEMNELQAKFYARRGYVYAVQDCRGRFASEGEWVPFFHEPEDGYDSIEWLAKQPYSTGKVGMIGASYVGWVQWWAARERPPHLVTIIPNVAPPDPYFNVPYEYGVFFLTGAIWWANVLEQEATADLTGEAMRRVMREDYSKKLRHLPVVELDTIILGKENRYWRSWIAHPDNDAWWEEASFLDQLQDLDIPVFHQSGWFDGDGIGSKLNYLRMASHGHAHQKLVLGPWGHTDTATRGIGDADFGAEAWVDLQRDYLRWFDRWLKGVENGIEHEPLVSLFVMETNQWLRGDTYPLPGTEFQKWYLRSGGNANTTEGDGVLSVEPPPAEEPPDLYVYDPGDPTPSPQLPLAEDAEAAGEAPSEKEEGPGENEEDGADFPGSWVAQTRQDVLVYESEPFTAPLTFAGPLSAVLYAGSDAKDTDWFVRVGYVDQDGLISYLATGKIRARYRKSFAAPEPLAAGEIAEYRIDCWQTGLTLMPGQRLRVEVASADFPMFSRNLNTGGHNETETEFVSARQTVYHDAEHPSHLLLPVIPKPEWGGQ